MCARARVCVCVCVCVRVCVCVGPGSCVHMRSSVCMRPNLSVLGGGEGGRGREGEGGRGVAVEGQSAGMRRVWRDVPAVTLRSWVLAVDGGLREYSRGSPGGAWLLTYSRYEGLCGASLGGREPSQAAGGPRGTLGTHMG